MLKTFFQPLLAWYLAALKTTGFPVIVLLMTMESSVLPIPSEAIIPPAAYLAWSDGINLFDLHLAGWQGELALVIAGTFGSWMGATIIYWLARLAGRPLLLKYGRYILLSPAKIQKSENWMAHYGPMGVFIARLLPGARQLIGIPAGIARMDYLKFSFFVVLGAAIWCAVLCWLGVKIGGNISKGEMHQVMFWVGGTALALGGLYYIFVHRHLKQKKS